jgi:hypothetical protein
LSAIYRQMIQMDVCLFEAQERLGRYQLCRPDNLR